MKRTARHIEALLFAVLLVLVSTNSHGGSLSNSPGSIELAIAPGSQGTAPLTITLQNPDRGSYYLWFIDTISGGNLPLGWLTASPSTTFLNTLGLTASTSLAINVPKGTAPGIYSGQMMSKAMAAHGFADPGPGSLIKVTVLSVCAQPPSFEITSFGPDTLWPPNHKMIDVVVSGRVILNEGCTLMETGYNIFDEYGVYTSAGQLVVSSDGTFALSLPVEAGRNGNDMDGRYYTITLSARDEAGIGTGSRLDVLVPHDQRKK
jgi:hypothetical protein